MHKISIINKERQDIIIDKVKFISGNNYENKDLIYRILVNYFNKLNISDYSKDNNIESCIYFDDSPLRIADFDFYLVSDYFDMDFDSKLGLKSISLAFINKMLEDVEYKDEFNSINSLLCDLLDNILDDFDFKIKPLLEGELNKKTLIKLLNYSFLNENSIINNYDLSLEDKILLQFEMIAYISKKALEKTLIIAKIPYVNEAILNVINKINGFILCIVDSIGINIKCDDCLILNKNYSIDIADDNKIFELCNTSNSYLTIKEMKEKVMKDHLKIYN